MPQTPYVSRPVTLVSSPSSLTAEPPLSAEEEGVLAIAYARGRQADALLAQGVAGDEPEHVLQETVARGMEARTRLILANIRLVKMFARRHEGRGVPLSDLVQEGVVGLIAAVERFDAQRGTRFSSYASAWIRHHVAEAASARRAIRLPPRVEAAVLTCREAHDAFVRDNGGASPTVGDIAEAVGLAEELVGRMLAADQPALPLETLTSEAASSLALAPDAAGRDVRAEGLLRPALVHLPADERDVVDRRYGLDGGGPRSAGAVALELGRDLAWVRATERRALRFLRKHPALADLAR